MPALKITHLRTGGVTQSLSACLAGTSFLTSKSQHHKKKDWGQGGNHQSIQFFMIGPANEYVKKKLVFYLTVKVS